MRVGEPIDRSAVHAVTRSPVSGADLSETGVELNAARASVVCGPGGLACAFRPPPASAQAVSTNVVRHKTAPMNHPDLILPNRITRSLCEAWEVNTAGAEKVSLQVIDFGSVSCR